MAEGVDSGQHRQPPVLNESIRSELDCWSLGKFSRMNFWRQGPRSGATLKYTGEDILQTGILDVESRLGEGGMGHVYLARNKEDGTTVAVKIGKEGPDRTGIKSQLVEIIARDRLPDGHENLVKSYGFCDRTPGCPIFFEACDGGDLFEAAVDGHLMKSVEILGLVRDVVSALGFLHEHGIIHCDVKAENILLQTNEKGGYTPKLTDFGGAMAAGEPRQGGGTFGYTAPEVIFGTRPAHGSQDAWAVGHMLLVMLTKRRHRASNMFKHSRLQTEADHELKATMTRLGEGDMFERYVTFRNMVDFNTLDTLLCEDLFDEDLAKRPEVDTGIRQLLQPEAARRPPMAVAHGWLGLVIAGLNETMEKREPSLENILRDTSSKERLPHSANTPLSTATGTLATPPGFPTTDTKDRACLPPPPGFPAIGVRSDSYISPPPGFPPIGAKNAPYLIPPPAEDAAATSNVNAAPSPLVNESSQAASAEGETRIPTTTLHSGEIESHPSTTSTVAETEGLAASASRLKKLSKLPRSEISPQEDGVSASAQPRGGQPAVRPTDGEMLGAAEADAQAVRRAPYRHGVERCSRPRTAVLGMGFPAAIRQYDVTPRISDAGFYSIDQQRAAPTMGAHGRGIPRVFQAANAAVPPAYYYHGAPTSYTRGGHGVAAAGFGAEGGPPSRPPPSWAPRCTGQKGGHGRWTRHVAGGPGVPRQEGNVFQSRHHIGGVQAHWQQRPSPNRRNNNNDRYHHHIGHTMRAELPGKNRMKKQENRRGGHNQWRSGPPQQTPGLGDVSGYRAGRTVPHAITVNGAVFFYPGGRGFYPWQWHARPVGAW